MVSILAYQFIIIHPFPDGNGRTCRALATWALRTGADESVIDPIGLLNVEEFYAADLRGYYEALQMGCHFSYYDSNERGSRSRRGVARAGPPRSQAHPLLPVGR